MFERVKRLFIKGGVSTGMIDELNSILDHEKISLKQSEYDRIQENIKHYQANYGQISYTNSNGEVKKRQLRSLNMSKILSRKLAKMVFNEGVQINVNDDKQTDAFIQETFRKSKFTKRFGEELEAGYAIGGLVLRPYYDKASDSIKISFSKPDSFFPINGRANEVNEMAFTTETVVQKGKEKLYYTLVELHLWQQGMYVIENELYESDKPDKLGRKVGLSKLEKYADLNPRSILPQFTRPLFVYIRLAGKNNKDIYSSFGLSIIENSKPQIVDINKKYDQFMWEVEQAGRKIIASEHFFKTSYDSRSGQPRFQFDDDTNVYKTIRSDEPVISEFSPDLRTKEFVDTIDFILRVIEMQSGFSTGTFSFDGQSVKTATEVVAENSESYSTRADNVQIIEEALKELIISILELADFYEVYTKPSEVHSVIDFDDGVFQSTEDKFNFYSKSVAMQMMPKVIGIQRTYGVSEETALEWLQMMIKEAVDESPIEQEVKRDEMVFGPRE